MLGNLLRRAAEPDLVCHRLLQGGQFDALGTAGAGHLVYLLLAQAHQAQGGGELHGLLKVGAGLFDGLFLGVADEEAVAHGHVLAQGQLPAVGGGALLIHRHPLGQGRLRRVGNQGLDAHAAHKVDALGVAADQGLPDFHRLADGPGHQADLLQLVAPIGYVGGELVVLALVGEGFLAKGLDQHLYLLLEQLPVGVAVQHGGGEGFDFAGVVAAAHAEDDPPAGEDVGHGVVLGQTQGVPHGGDVEAAAVLEPPGVGGQVEAEHQQVGDALVAFGLEVVFGHPELVVAQAFQVLGEVQGPVEGGGQALVGVAAVVGRGAVEAEVVVHDVAGIGSAKTAKHRLVPLSFVYPRRDTNRHEGFGWEITPSPESG